MSILPLPPATRPRSRIDMPPLHARGAPKKFTGRPHDITKFLTHCEKLFTQNNVFDDIEKVECMTDAPRPVILVPRLISAPIHAANSSDDEIVEVDPPSYVQSITESGTTSASRRRGRRVRAPLPLVNLTGLPEGRARRTLPLPRNPPTARSQHIPPARPRISPKWDPPLVTSGSTFSRLTQCLKMVVDLSQPYAEFARGDTTASIPREQARNDDNRIPSVLEILYNNRLKARLTKAFILLLQAQENYATAHGQPHSLLPGSNVICHYLNLPTLPDELARLSSPNHSYSDWEPFHAALYSIFGDYSESPLIRSILERAPLAPHLVDVPYYLKANMTAADPLVRQLAAIRQIFESVIGRLSIVTGEVQRLQSSTQFQAWMRENFVAGISSVDRRRDESRNKNHRACSFESA
ncbi:hypothetical protein R3P38DRAFT_3235181 [Favolaschia claudopus]|uniref:Uncharacterized protein n=1 Tax=Favolaschia claudopus TaxID=2862362 RepID=A0AAV9ZGD8_9AGAR